MIVGIKTDKPKAATLAQVAAIKEHYGIGVHYLETVSYTHLDVYKRQVYGLFFQRAKLQTFLKCSLFILTISPF